MFIPTIQQVKYFRTDQYQVKLYKINGIFSSIFISEIFRDLPETLEDPSYQQHGGIRIEDAGVNSEEIQSFGNFFDQNQYVDNPFGKDFIKLEIDVDRFGTNKTSKFFYCYYSVLK